MVAAPLSYGKSWVTENVNVIPLDGSPTGDPFDYALTVYFEGELVVPAGLFYAYGIGQELPLPGIRSSSGQVFDVFGNRIAESGSQGIGRATEWYVDSVGLVQIAPLPVPEYTYALLWLSQPTAGRAWTWGGIKLLYDRQE